MTKMKKVALTRVIAGGLVLTAFGATQASAELIKFDFLDGLDTFGFQLDDADFQNNTTYFSYQSTKGYFNNNPIDFNGFGSVNIFDPTATDGVSVQFASQDYSVIKTYSGPALYNGPNTSPTIRTGSYTFTNYFGEPGMPSLNVSRAAAGPGAPAPEVGVGLLSALVAGLGLALTRMRGNPFASLLNRRRAALA